LPGIRVGRIILLFLIIGGILFALRTLKKLSADKIGQLSRLVVFGFLLLFFLYLGATGRLQGFFALLGLLIALLVRMLPSLIRYAPYLHRLWMEYTGRQYYSSQNKNNKSTAKDDMTHTEAYDILGIKPGATKDEIIAAHRKLMQKMHPDRGGSDYLAAKINAAKKKLLS
jgi:hypothetical protein